MSDGAYMLALAVIALCAVVIILAYQYRVDVDGQLDQAERRRILRELDRHDQ